MDPLWATLAEWWWIAPTAVGAGTLGVIGLRRSRDGHHARRLGYDAARHALRAAQSQVAAARIAVRVARAELARAQAERAASRATSAEVAAARQRLQTAQRETKAASASVRVWRTRVSAERVALPRGGDPALFPLARLLAVHDAVTARWMEYETDPAKLIAFPTMSDGRVPTVATYLAAYREAQQLRPASPRERITPAQFADYREAVARLETAFAAAEQDAWRQARAAGSIPPEQPDRVGTASWTVVAQTIVTRSAEALARATEAAVTGSGKRDGTGSTDAAGAAQADAAGTTPPDSASGDPEATSPPPTPAADGRARSAPPSPVWPVPARTDRRHRP